MQFEGIYTPVVTPFNEDGSIHYEDLGNAIDQLIDAGVHGIISGGSTGENYTQTVEERIQLAKYTCARAAGRAPVIIGVGAMRTADSIDIAVAAKAAGASALLVGTPPYAVPTERENALNVLAIDRAADLPIMLYNYPGRMGVSMGQEFFDRVGRSKNIRGIKESSGDINQLHMLARDYSHIQLSCGMDDQALEFFAWGARSWVCAGSNFLPKEHIALYEACVLHGDFSKGRRIMSAMMPLMRVLEQGGKFIQCIKYGVEMSGGRAGALRPPLRALNKSEKREMDRVVRVLKQTIQQIISET